MTGKRGLSWERSSSCGVSDGAVAGVVAGDVGLTSPVSLPVPAGISKSGASPLAALTSKAVIGPIPRPGRRQWRSGALTDPRWLARQCPGFLTTCRLSDLCIFPM
jgi:hypothetical protein